MSIDPSHVLYFLAARIPEQIPSDYIRLTHPLKVTSELHIIQAMWETLRFTEAVASVRGGKLSFWRLRNNNAQSARLRLRQSVKNYVRRASR
jgi:hypothetical protein